MNDFFSRLIYCAASILALIGAGFAQAQAPDAQLTDAEILALIPASSDGYFSDEERAQLQRLTAMGDRIYPLLSAKLLETNDHRRTGVLIGLLAKGAGDKVLPRATFRAMIQKWSGTAEEAPEVRRVLASALGDVGMKDDAPVLLQLANDPSIAVSTTALKALGKIGDESVAQEIESWMTHRKTSLPLEQQRRDVLLEYAALAVTAIRARSGAANPP